MNLRVIPTKDAMVPDLNASAAKVLRFVGWKHDATKGENGAFVMSPEPVELPYAAEYVQELRAGMLLPADAETAAIAGVPFTAPKAQ